MYPAISLVTLGVRDFNRSLRFYRDGLGWATTAKEGDPVAFFLLNSLGLSLFPREELAKDANVPEKGTGFQGITLAQNVASPEAVDAMLAAAAAAGANITKTGEKTFWGGYNGYFKDPDGFLWEIAHNPFWVVSEGKIMSLEKPE